jgi:hypothetical protein
VSGKLVILGLAGAAGVGKTTVRDLLYNLIFHAARVPTRMSFATPIKQFLGQLGIQKDNQRFRTLAQKLSCLREIDPDIYLPNLASVSPGILLIDDVRYENELNWILAQGQPGKVYRLVRAFESPLSYEQAHHPSETQPLSVPVIENYQDNPYRTASELAWMVFPWLNIPRPIRFYLAMPMSGGNQEENVKAAKRAAGMLRERGYHVYLPHGQEDPPYALKGTPGYTRGWEESVSILRSCWPDFVVYHGADESRGVQDEIQLAKKLNIPAVKLGTILS